MTERKTRLARILEIIEEQDIGTQEDLAKALRREGFDVTQATVSRDIRQLRLEKSRTPDGGQKYIAPKDDAALLVGKFSRVMKDGLVSMDQAQNILVIKTAWRWRSPQHSIICSFRRLSDASREMTRLWWQSGR